MPVSNEQSRSLVNAAATCVILSPMPEPDDKTRLISLVDAAAIPPSHLLTELNRLGLHFVVGSLPESEPRPLSPDELIAGLVKQSDARLRLALIALFLYQPKIAGAVPEALRSLTAYGKTQLKLFYSAARLLQLLYAPGLRQFIEDWYDLPDLFSADLGLSQVKDQEHQLKELAQLHQKLSGIQANWLGTYQHAAQRLMARLAREVLWQSRPLAQ